MKRIGLEPVENARARGYAAKFEAEHPDESPVDDLLADTFATCVAVPPFTLYPLIRQQLEVIRHEKVAAGAARASQAAQIAPVSTARRKPIVDAQLPIDGVFL